MVRNAGLAGCLVLVAGFCAAGARAAENMRMVRPLAPVLTKQLIVPVQGGQALKLMPLALRGLREQGLLAQRLNQKVAVEGFYFDGSIPMVIDDVKRTELNTVLPEDCYVPIVGAVPTGFKSGDRISLSGRLVRPTTAALAREPAVLQLENAGEAKLLLRATSLLHVSRLTDRIDIGPIIKAMATKHAILLAGGANPASNYMRYWNDLHCMYQILLKNGYPAANIYVIYADGVAKGPGMPVNYSCTKANLSLLFTQVAAKMRSGDTLYVMTNDHGGPGSGGHVTMNLWGESIWDTEFAAQVNKVQSYATMIIQMEQCYSGGMLDELTGPRRVLMSAASATQPSWGGAVYNAWTYWVFAGFLGKTPDTNVPVNADANGDGKVSMLEIFNFARSRDTASEIPQYEDNAVVPCHSGVMPAGGEGAFGTATTL